jgi:hypothetical protein
LHRLLKSCVETFGSPARSGRGARNEPELF